MNTLDELIRSEIMLHRDEAIADPSLLQASQGHIDALYHIRRVIAPYMDATEPIVGMRRPVVRKKPMTY